MSYRQPRNLILPEMQEVALIREASHEAAGLHQNRLRVRWRMAIGRPRAAARETAAHRNTRFGPDRVAAVDCRFDRASAGTLLDRGRHDSDRASLGHRKIRSRQ